MKKINILISEPSLTSDYNIFLPYVWGVLKTYCDQIDLLRNTCHWLNPIYLSGNSRDLLAEYDLKSIDVLGLSCYVWNWNLQKQIADDVKNVNPNCLVVAGGPEPNYKDPEFFLKNPQIDLVVRQDGEIPFSEILLSVSDNKANFSDIPGVIEKNSSGNNRKFAPATLPKKFEVSPYIEQSSFYESVIRNHKNVPIGIVWETTRGCPYGCSFCDWGSSTLSKIRLFNEERIAKEAAWISKQNIEFMFIADANFGMFDRDFLAVKHLCEAKAKNGAPKTVYFSPTKKNIQRSAKITEMLFNSKINVQHILSLQHTSDKVLDSINRRNASLREHYDALTQIRAKGIPTYVQLIQGCPGDTPELWLKTLTDLMEWGIHGDYQCFPFFLLPNSPAANPDYLKKFEIETVTKCVPTGNFRRPKEFNNLNAMETKIVVQTSTYSQAQWIDMCIYTNVIVGLHNFGILKFIAIFLRFSYGISYFDFYKNLVEHFSMTSGSVLNQLILGIKARKTELLKSDSGLIDELELKEVPPYPFLVTDEEHVFIKCCLNLERFYEEVFTFLKKTYEHVDELRSVVNYQKEVIVTSDYDPRIGKTFETDRLWTEYFTKYENLKAPSERVEVPSQTYQRKYELRTKTIGVFKRFKIDWVGNSLDDMNRQAKWINAVVGRPFQRSQKSVFDIRTIQPSVQI